MIIVQDKLVSNDLVEAQFACNLSACKGACCWEGDAGAPLEAEELPVLEAIYEKIKPFLSPAGIHAIEQQGLYVWYEDDWGTTLIENGPCAYLALGADGIGQCGIEKAWKAGVIDFQKPVSCHLYPVRVSKNDEHGFEALNYHQWDICAAACTRGAAEQIPVYQFVKDALIRKYGPDFYEELDAVANFLQNNPE